MPGKSKKELDNEDLKDAREKNNEWWVIFFRGIANIATIIGLVVIICFLSYSPDSLKEFLSFLRDIFSNNKTYWAMVGGLSISNYALYKLILQKNNTVAKLDEVLQNSLPQNNKALLIQIEELFKKIQK